MKRFFRSVAAVAVCSVFALACQDDVAKLGEHKERGQGYLEAESFAEAVIEYKSALQIDPNDAAAHYGLAKAYLGQKQPRKAYWELQETVRLDDANIEAKIEYAQFLLFGKEDELGRAVELADEILESEPDRWQADVLKGRALQALRRPDEALASYQAATEKAPEEGGPLLLLANFYRERGDRDSAEPLFQKLTQVEPGFPAQTALASFLAIDRNRDGEAEAAYRKGLDVAKPEQRVTAYSVLANFLISRDRADEAEALLRDGVESEEKSRELSYALARFYNARGESEKADAMISEAANADPSDPDPYLVLSAYRGKRGDVEGALAAAEQALKAKPDHTPAKLRKAELLIDKGFREGDPDSTIAGRTILDAVISQEPSNPQALLVGGKLALSERRFDDAERGLRQAIDQRPDWPQAHFLLGSTLFLQRDFLAARAEVTRAIELDANFTEAERVLARIEVALGEDERAAEIGQRALRRSPDDDQLRILVAQSLVRQGRKDEGRRVIEAIPPERRNAEAHYALGRIAIIDNDRAEAREHFEA
ncbi:MAG: tetratricopeptide repeat protein, partial [Myxococcales bacterium]|nr:tetratricopeptide repeat protein [Myxococcales bacterium]